LEKSALLDELQPKLQDATNEVLAKRSADAKTKLDAVIDEGLTSFKKVILMTQDHPELAVMANGKALDDTLDQLVNAVKKGDEPDSHVLLKHAKNKMAQQSMLAQVIAESTMDKHIKEQLILHAANLDDLTDTLTAAVNHTLAHPVDMPDLMKVVTEVKNENHAIMDLSQLNIAKKKEEEERKRREEEERIRREEERLRREEEARLEALRLEEERRKKAEQARLEALRLEQERIRREAEERRLQELKKIEAEKLEREERVRRERLAAEEAERRRKEEEARIEAERRKIEEEERLERLRREEAERKRKEEEMARDEVMAAARALAERVAQANKNLGGEFPEFTGEGKLVDLARRIGELMKQMSLAAKNNNKAEMIRIAQQIAALVKEIITQANEQAKNCTDARLADSLVRAAQSVSSFAIQLKIIAAVKAAVEGDKSAKQQLIKCAQGLCSCVVNTVNAAESAALRDKDRKKKK